MLNTARLLSVAAEEPLREELNGGAGGSGPGMGMGGWGGGGWGAVLGSECCPALYVSAAAIGRRGGGRP